MGAAAGNRRTLIWRDKELPGPMAGMSFVQEKHSLGRWMGFAPGRCSAGGSWLTVAASRTRGC